MGEIRGSPRQAFKMKTDLAPAAASEPSVPSGDGMFLPFQDVALRGRRFSHRLVFSPVLFAFDVISWILVYSFCSVLLNTGNLYGKPELILPPIVLSLSLALVGGYSTRTAMASLKYATEHLIATVVAGLFTALALYLVFSFGAGMSSSRLVFFVAFLGTGLLTLAERRVLWFAIQKFRPRRSFLVIGDEVRGPEFHRAYERSGQSQELDFVTCDPALVGTPVGGPATPVYGASVVELLGRLKAHPENVHEAIIIAAQAESLDRETLALLTTIHFRDIPVYSLTGFYEAYWQKMPLHLLSATWPLQAGFHLVKHSAFSMAKRAMDILIAGPALVLLSPLLLLIAVAIRLDSRGPVLFRQDRVGQYRTLFTIFKFRTMKLRSEEGDIYTRKNDARITRVGGFLRATRLDEIPQLFNVLRGDMSLIGPRAEWIKCVREYEEVIPYYHFRHLVRPGITGWAQVNYPYGASLEDAREKLMFDLYYVRNFSLCLDAAVIIKTAHVMLFGKGT